MGNRNQIYIFFSLKREANSLLSQSEIKFKRISNNQFQSSCKDFKINLIITGIWKKCIQAIDNLNLNDPLLIIKAGTCAVLDDRIKLGKIFIPFFVSYKDQKIEIPFSGIPDRIKNELEKLKINAGLLTQDEPLFNSAYANKLFKNGFCAIDMETFFIKQKFPGIPFIPLLVGTDRGDKKAIIDFFKNLANASKMLKEEIAKIVKLL